MSVHSRKSKESPGAGSSHDEDRGPSAAGGGLTRIQARSGRLPSLKPKRDLTLGGVPKKTFTPTIPASRRIKKEPGALSTSEEAVDDKKPRVGESPKGKKHRPSLDKKGKREQKKKGKKEVITAASVFSMGPADRPMEGRTGFTPGTFGAELAKRPVPSSSANKDGKGGQQFASGGAAGDSEEDVDPVGGTVEELFSSSFIPPVQLPLDYFTHNKQKTLPQVKTVKRIKQEPQDEIEDMDTNEAKDSVLKPGKEISASSEVKGHQMTAAELFTPAKNAKGKFLFIQLPDCLPISLTTGKEAHQPMETDKSSRASSIVTTASGTSAVNSEGESEQRQCSLADVPEGFIGKLRVHRSGKVKMTLGEVTMDVAMGTSCGFLQQLVSVRQGPPQSKMTVLGQLSHRLVCSPDFETMLEEMSREPQLQP